MQGVPVERARDGRMTEQRLRLRGEEKEGAALPVVERLLAQAIPREQQSPPGAVPEGEGEHAPQPLDARRPERLVGLQDDLGVALRPEGAPFRLQRGAQVSEVVDLAVED